MIKPEQVPDAAYNAALAARINNKTMRAAIAAAINAWPDATIVTVPGVVTDVILHFEEKTDGGN